MKQFAILWFKSGRSSMALAARWRKQGYSAEAALLGARDAVAYYAASKRDKDSAHAEALSMHFFYQRRIELAGGLEPETATEQTDTEAATIVENQKTYFEQRKEELRKERYLQRLRAAKKTNPRYQPIDRGPRDGVIEKLPEYEDRRDTMPRYGEGLRKRIA